MNETKSPFSDSLLHSTAQCLLQSRQAWYTEQRAILSATHSLKYKSDWFPLSQPLFVEKIKCLVKNHTVTCKILFSMMFFGMNSSRIVIQQWCPATRILNWALFRHLIEKCYSHHQAFEFDHVLFHGHFHLYSITISHRIDAKTRNTTGSAVDSTVIRTANCTIEVICFSLFRYPSFIQGDGTFQISISKRFLGHYDVCLRPLSPLPHCRTMIEFRHETFRSIALFLKNAEPYTPHPLQLIVAITLSNNPHSSNSLSTFEIAKGLSKPL